MSAHLEKLQQLAVKRFGDRAAALGPDQDLFEGLGIDSLQALDLLSDLEGAFRIEIPDWEVQGINTLRGLAEVVERRL